MNRRNKLGFALLGKPLPPHWMWRVICFFARHRLMWETKNYHWLCRRCGKQVNALSLSRTGARSSK